MNGRERIKAIIEGNEVDRVPLFPQISYANIITVPGMSIKDFSTNPEAMAKATITSYNRFKWDAIALHTDVSILGMALGSEYTFPEDAPAKLNKPLLNNIREVDKINIPNPYEAKGMATVIEAVQLVKKEVSQDTCIASWTTGPLNAASQLVDLSELLIGMIDAPGSVHLLLDKCLDTAISYGKALIDSGAEFISYGHAVASNNVISPTQYLEFALPYEKRLVRALMDHGAVAVGTHICGDIERTIEFISDNGSSVIDVDHANNMSYLLEHTDKILRGNIDPLLLSRGPPKEVYEECRNIILECKDSKRLILGSGCDIQKDTPLENLDAMVKAVDDFGKY